ncbi:ABC transporter ATP-binding protein [Streptomyces sp. NBRC 109706]|uniref:dipeptide ABC transporter ATP-binding protein n=1 Tax=Streptomyces sp. NBRC 109706 TaxID=1550035 RepID=UPI000A87EFFD|nr:ABC transporter ATP-binding protein [Streptomyces sp. NBRC 109706]
MSSTATRAADHPRESAETAKDPLVRVRNLRIGFDRAGTVTPVVRGVSFDIRPGRCLAIVGESGSGKSVTARTLVGLTGPGAVVEADLLEWRGRDLRGLSERRWRAIRGREIGFVLQDALVSLDQLRTVGAEVAEPLRTHRRGDRRSRRARVLEVLAEVGVPEPELRAAQRPYELSGGLRQRALIASALALDPDLVIADEPTTALDATVQAQVLDVLADTLAHGRALVLISHDLAVVARLADEIAVLKDGVIVEQGPSDEVLHSPQHPYTQALLDAIPTAHTRGTRLSPEPGRAPAAAPGRRPGGVGPLLTADELVKRYRGPDERVRTVVDRVSFELRPGETLGIVGESGSGKTTTARMALALLAPDEGRVLLDGAPWTETSRARRRPLRHRVGLVPQDPLSSFDPRWTVGQVLADAVATDPRPVPDVRARSVELLEQVGLGERHLTDRPLRLSGGQRQRVAIARALAPRPELLVCDEPVSALDVSVQARVLDLFADLKAELGVAYLFISHDLGVIHHVSDRVLVMKDGRVVEEGPVDRILTAPKAPYTRQLLAALPRLEPVA